MFYTYRQNNSGGVFKVNDNVKHYVIIEADSAKEADGIAESIGIYFDGVKKDIDCPCCGNRWSKADDPDFGIEGTKEPEIYGQRVLKFFKESGWSLWKEEAIVYYKSGKVKVIKEAKMTNKLKPCPFCKSDNVSPNEFLYAIPLWSVHCLSCGTRGPDGHTKQEAIEAWNSRAGEDK